MATSESALMNEISPLSPILLLSLLFYWPLKACLRVAIRSSNELAKLAKLLRQAFKQTEKTSASQDTAAASLFSHRRFMLIVAMISVALLTYFPYRGDLNPSGTPVGIDTPRYVNWLNQMLQRPSTSAIAYAFGQGSDGSRPFHLLLLYLVALLGAQADQVVKFQPLVLGPTLVLSNYVLVLKGGQIESLAGPTAILTAFSPSIAVGMWAGYYANWLALIESNFLLALVLTFRGRPSPSVFWVMMTLSLALVLTHPWTWALVLSFTGVFALTFWKGNKSFFYRVGMLIVVGIAVDALKAVLVGASALSSESGIFGPSQVPILWRNVVEALRVLYSGLLGYWLILLLGLAGVLALKTRDGFQRLLVLWVSVCSLPFALTDGFHQSRVVYDLPIAILASIGVFTILSKTRLNWPHSTLLFLLLVLANANYAISSITQL